MNPSRRTALHTLPALLAAAAAPAWAQAWPARPIRLVLPFAAGGAPDVLARQITPKLGAVLGQTVYVDNKVGAGGIIAAEHVAMQPPDGYTLLVGGSFHVTQKLLKPSAAFDPLKSFQHVIRISFSPSVLVVGARSPYQSLDDLLRAARAAPGTLNYGSSGIGSVGHLGAAAIATHGQVNVAHIPYRSSAELLTGLGNNDIAFAVLTASNVVPLLAKGVLRPLAVTSAQRDPALPTLPTLKELTGSDELVLVGWTGVWVPAGTPAPIVRRLFDAHAQVYADPEIAKANAAIGVTMALSRSEAEFSDFVAAEVAKYARLVKAARIELT